MTESTEVKLELEDIQSLVLRPRPTPYASTYIGLRIDDARAGRELIARIRKVVTSAANPTSPLADTWVSVALTYHGLKALGVPQNSLDSFAWEFRQGIAARAKELGLQGLPRFVITRGGEYCFMPGLKALQWLAELET